MKNKNILVILGHPSKDSLNKEIADIYIKEAKNSDFNVRKLYLYDKKFDLVLHEGFNKKQKLEPDLKKAQKDIKWADHLVFIYPIWWGTMPALFKGFIDRTLLPGFAFEYKENSMIPEKFLKGKSARIITTSGMPGFLFCLINSNKKLMKRFVLNFTGIKPVRNTNFGSADEITDEKFSKIQKKVRKLARKGK